MKSKMYLFFAASLVVIGFISTIYKGYVRFNYPSFKTYPVQGLDISHHQGVINWGKLKTSNYKFIYIKATEGGDFKDPKFKLNWKNSRSNKFLTGAYHFFTLCKGGLEQAQNFIAEVPSGLPMLPPAIDLEFVGNCSKRPSVQKLIEEVKVFAKKIEETYQQKPILYVTSDFYKIYLKKANLPYKLWVRNIYSSPTIPNKKDWLFWQYANRGHVAGINTYVDLNVFNGRFADLEYLLQK